MQCLLKEAYSSWYDRWCKENSSSTHSIQSSFNSSQILTLNVSFYLQKTPSGMGNSPLLKLPKMPQIRFHSYTFLPLFPFSCWPAFELFSSGQGAQTWCAELFLWAPPHSASWLTVCRKVFWQPSHAKLLTTLRTSNVVQKNWAMGGLYCFYLQSLFKASSATPTSFLATNSVLTSSTVGGWHTCGHIQHTYGAHHFRLGKTRLVFPRAKGRKNRWHNTKREEIEHQIIQTSVEDMKTSTPWQTIEADQTLDRQHPETKRTISEVRQTDRKRRKNMQQNS